MVGMVITAVWIEREDDVRRHVRDDPADRGFHFEHVHVRQRASVAVPLALTARRVVEPQKHWRIDAKPLTRQSQFLGTQRPEVVNGSDRWMGLAGLTVSGADERDANTLLTQVHQHPAMKELVVWMREDDEQRRAA
jgi:hypothetical protein